MSKRLTAACVAVGLFVALALAGCAAVVPISGSVFKARVDCVMVGGYRPGYRFHYDELQRTDQRAITYKAYTYTTPKLTSMRFTMTAVGGLSGSGLMRCDFTVIDPNINARGAPGTVVGHKTIHGKAPAGAKATVLLVLVNGKIGFD